MGERDWNRKKERESGETETEIEKEREREMEREREKGGRKVEDRGRKVIEKESEKTITRIKHRKKETYRWAEYTHNKTNTESKKKHIRKDKQEGRKEVTTKTNKWRVLC